MSNLNFGKKLWIRVDASGNAIANSSVWRKKKPSAGKWKEILNPNLCCNFVLPPVDIVETIADDSLDGFTFTLLCDGSDVLIKEITDNVADIQEMTESLNSNLAFLGEFEVTAVADITLHLKAEIAESLCPGGVLSFTIV